MAGVGAVAEDDAEHPFFVFEGEEVVAFSSVGSYDTMLDVFNRVLDELRHLLAHINHRGFVSSKFRTPAYCRQPVERALDKDFVLHADDLRMNSVA